MLVVLFASQLPDLIDKPLAWQFNLLPSGRSLAHSVFFGVLVSLLAITFARRRKWSELGIAFTVGYLSHLATDTIPLYPGSSTSFESVLWPLRSYEESSEYDQGVIADTYDIVIDELASLATLEPSLNTAVGAVLIGLMGVIWVVDGTPGLKESIHLLRYPTTLLRTVIR